MKIIFAGGGTLGSVAPLIAIWQKLKEKDNKIEFLFIGTKNGLEKEFVARYQIPYRTIITGKWRRYFSFWNFIDIFKFGLSVIQSFNLLRKLKPGFIISAGSFVAVPLIWAAYFFKTKVIFYQSDFKIGLANRLCQKQADYIFTTFSETVSQFPQNKTVCLGTLLREEIKQVQLISINERHQPTILILGGGTGSAFINQLIGQSLAELTKIYKIVHITGQRKKNLIGHRSQVMGNYWPCEILTDDYYQKMAEADLVVSRAGVSTLMELSYLGKPVILIPLPNSAQVENAVYLCQRNAAICLEQKNLTPKKLTKTIEQIINDKRLMSILKDNIYQIFNHDGGEIIAQKIYELK